MISDEHQKLFEIVLECAAQTSCEVYIVGGYVRDLLLESPLEDQDVDFILEGEIETFVRELQHRIGGEVKSYPRFLTAKIFSPQHFNEIEEIDFAHARTEIYKTPGSLPQVSASTIREDLFRRDFTINAIAITLRGFLDFLIDDHGQHQLLEKFFDPFGGIRDLESRKIKILHEKSFVDDPTRLFRAVRYRERIEGEFEGRTGELFQEALQSGQLQNISTYRTFQELKKSFEEQEYEEIFFALADYGLLEQALKVSPQVVDALKQSVSGLSNDAPYSNHIKDGALARFEAFLLSYAAHLDKEGESQLVQDLGIGKSRWRELQKLTTPPK